MEASGPRHQPQGTALSLGVSTHTAHTAVNTLFHTLSSNYPVGARHLFPAGILMEGTPTLGAEEQTEHELVDLHMASLLEIDLFKNIN